MSDPRALLDDYESSDADPWESGEETVGQQAPAAFAALRAVLDLHRQHESLHATCVECSETEDTYNDIPWPCPTVQAITTTLEAK